MKCIECEAYKEKVRQLQDLIKSLDAEIKQFQGLTNTLSAELSEYQEIQVNKDNSETLTGEEPF